ncbi:glycoside hydrolase family 9 protein [Limibacter armeniacum]|uniref:glycoside hydrolase family 9 protein n=1 Tax=Limibacter armeniacum TaxID=466084 RepID=UPI002FE63BD6
MHRLDINFKYLLLTFWLTCSVSVAIGQQPTSKIRLNQLGYYPTAPKKAVVNGAESKSFYILTPDLADTLYTGKLGKAEHTTYSKAPIQLVDFSAFSQVGEFVLSVPEAGVSYPFHIDETVFEDAGIASLRAFYYQRASVALDQQYAGKWYRKAGHPDDKVLVHASAASQSRPEGTQIVATGGWYDAGDYNKYIVNSGITMGTLLSIYEDYPEYFKQLNSQIPESGNEIPDLLDEVLWNLRWMLTMQDLDGGVYHKLTTPSFEGMDTRPDLAVQSRYVVQKTTAAALDFVAVMAQASRIFKAYNMQLPELSETCLIAAEKAWKWALAHPSEYYEQDELNRRFDPDITTGAYGDRQLEDEFIWAASELWVTTSKATYGEYLIGKIEEKSVLPSWGQVAMLGYYSMLRNEHALDNPTMLKKVRKLVVDFADELVQQGNSNPYQVVMGGSVKDFEWGSNAVAANQGIALIQAYHLTNELKYLELALANLDYLLGRNATGYSFLTGFGSQSPMNPHHRLSVSDQVDAPVPGLLVGGPNPGKQDNCQYPSDYPDEAYVDVVASYASNEIAINWNAPFVYLVFGLEALKQEAGFIHSK